MLQKKNLVFIQFQRFYISPFEILTINCPKDCVHSGITFKFDGHLRKEQVYCVEMAQISTGS